MPPTESLPATTDEKQRAAARITELQADRDDLIKQRALCLADIERCDRELSRPTFREHAQIVKEQRRESGKAIQVIDAEIGKVNRAIRAMNYFANHSLTDYFMDAAHEILAPDVFEQIKRRAKERCIKDGSQ